MKKRSIPFYCICIILLITHQIFSQTQWIQLAGDGAVGRGVAQTADGGYIMVGTMNDPANEDDIILVKLSADGTIEWSQTFGGPSMETGEQVCQTTDGGYIILGSTESYGAGDTDFWLIKTDANGDEIWNKTLGRESRDVPYDLFPTNEGGYIMTGTTDENETDVYLIKTDANGNKEWDAIYGGAQNDVGYSIRQTTDGGYIIGGKTRSYGAGNDDAWLIKTNANGNEMWNQTFGYDYRDAGSAVRQTTDGGYIFAGSSWTSWGMGHFDGWLIKTDANGSMQWEKSYGGSGIDAVYSVEQASDGGFILTGRNESHSPPESETWLIKTDATGNESWIQHYGLPPSVAWDVKQTTDGGYVMTGEAMGSKWCVIKTDANGETVDPTSTARGGLSLVIPVVERVFPTHYDLLYVSTEDMDAEGMALEWKYIFRSDDQQEFREFSVNGFTVTEHPSVSVHDPIMTFDMEVLKGNWIDSDSAIAVAERNGGSDFRNANPHWKIDAKIHYFDDLNFPNTDTPYQNPLWVICYVGDNNAEMQFQVDALTGELFGDYEKITVWKNFDQINAEALKARSDAELIMIQAFNVDSTGTADIWYFVYKSFIPTRALFEIWSQGDHAGLSDVRSFEDNRIRTSAPAITEYPVDSDSIIAFIEQNGGAEYRQANGECDIVMNLSLFHNGQSACRRPIWMVIYFAANTDTTFWFDAEIGTTYDQLPRHTAREKLSDIENVVSASLPADAQLVYLHADNVDPIGKAGRWKYHYESADVDSLIEVWLMGGLSIIPDTDHGATFPWLTKGMPPISTQWIDSDSALSHAENQGGEAFRNANAEWEINTRLQANEENITKWTVNYEAPTNYFGIDIEAEPKIKLTARARVNQVKTQALAIANDAQLIFVRANSSDETGKSSRWYYVFHSADLDSLFEVHVINGKIFIPEFRGVPWINVAMNPLPDQWMNSDEAVLAAEVSGGKEFRQDYSDWNIELDIHTTNYANETKWNVGYTTASSHENRSFEFNALFIGFTKGWSQTFGGASHDCGYGVLQTENGGFMIVGSTQSHGAGMQDTWLIEAGMDGTESWNLTFGGEKNECGQAIILDGDFGYMVADNTCSFSNGVYDGAMLGVYDSGTERLIRNFGGEQEDYVFDVIRTADDAYVLAGKSKSFGNGDSDFWIIKMDAEGNETWSKTFGGLEDDVCYSLQQTTDGGLILLGSTASSGQGKEDVWLIKTDSDGEEEWSKTFGGAESDIGYSVQQTEDGGYIIAGMIASYGEGVQDVWLIKTDAQGEEEWNHTFGGTANDLAKSVHQTSDGGFAIGATTESKGAGGKDVWLVKTDGQGNMEWDNTFGGEADDFAEALCLASDGGFILTGGTYSFGAGDCDVWLIKTDPNGLTSIDEDRTTPIPVKNVLGQNYPNPFNPETTIQFNVKERTQVHIAVYDLQGRQIQILLDNERPPGLHQIRFNANGLPSGLYFYKIQMNDFVDVKKMVLLE